MSKSDFTGPGIYLLQNASVTNLAVNLSNQGDQTAVVGWDATVKSGRTQWQIADAGNGEYLILSVVSGGYLLTSAEAKNGDLVHCRVTAPTDKRARWKIFTADWQPGAHCLSSVVNPDALLALKDGATENGTLLITHTRDGTSNWYIKLPPT